jgi:hypothetical protein
MSHSPDTADTEIAYHAWRWYVYIASAFPMVYHYRAVLA